MNYRYQVRLNINSSHAVSISELFFTHCRSLYVFLLMQVGSVGRPLLGVFFLKLKRFHAADPGPGPVFHRPQLSLCVLLCNTVPAALIC